MTNTCLSLQQVENKSLDNRSGRDPEPLIPLNKAANILEERVAALTLRLQELEIASDLLKKKENDLLFALHEKDMQFTAEKEQVTQWVRKYDVLKTAHERTESAVESSSEGVSQLLRECDAGEGEEAMLMKIDLLKEELKAAAIAKELQGQQLEEALTAQKMALNKEEGRIPDLEKTVRDGEAAVER